MATCCCENRRELKIVTDPYTCAAYLYSTVQQDVETYTVIAFDQQLIYPTDCASFDAANNALTINHPGLYEFTFYVDVAGETDVEWFAGVAINGTPVDNSMNGILNIATDATDMIYGQFIQNLSCGDVITLLNLSAGTLDIPVVTNAGTPAITGSNASLIVRKIA